MSVEDSAVGDAVGPAGSEVSDLFFFFFLIKIGVKNMDC